MHFEKKIKKFHCDVTKVFLEPRRLAVKKHILKERHAAPHMLSENRDANKILVNKDMHSSIYLKTETLNLVRNTVKFS